MSAWGCSCHRHLLSACPVHCAPVKHIVQKSADSDAVGKLSFRGRGSRLPLWTGENSGSDLSWGLQVFKRKQPRDVILSNHCTTDEKNQGSERWCALCEGPHVTLVPKLELTSLINSWPCEHFLGIEVWGDIWGVGWETLPWKPVTKDLQAIWEITSEDSGFTSGEWAGSGRGSSLAPMSSPSAGAGNTGACDTFSEIHLSSSDHLHNGICLDVRQHLCGSKDLLCQGKNNLQFSVIQPISVPPSDLPRA